MKLEQVLMESIRSASANVFTTMLGQDLPDGEVMVEETATEPNDGVVSFVGIAGTWAGTGSVSCSPTVACRICSQMLMTETTSVDADVLDAVAELTNMIIGCVKTDLESHLGPLGLSIPTVVYGRNFKTRSSRQQEWVVVNYHWDGEPLTVKMCLTRNERAAALGNNMHHLYALDV